MSIHALAPRWSRPLARPVGASLFGDLFGDFDTLFAELSRGLGVARRADLPATRAPRIDYSETPDEIRIHAEMPGLDEKDIGVSLEERVLTIEGRRAAEREEEDAETGYRHVESFRGSFRRSLRLPVEVDENAVTAAYRNGVLSVTLPKRPELKPEARTIPVTTG